MADVVEIKDFSFSDAPIQFKINDDVFNASPEMPLSILQDIVRLQNISTEIQTRGIEVLLEVFDQFLLDDSAQRFRARVFDKSNPIGIRHMMQILPWLLEQYGLRPTQPSSPSLSGSSDGEIGSSSTDGASPLVSTSPDPLLGQVTLSP